MPQQQAPLRCPLWTCIYPDGRQLVATDDDGNPDISIWETKERCVNEAPPKMIIVSLDEATFLDRLKQFPGDSQISIYRANGQRFRLPLKKMLADLLTINPNSGTSPPAVG